MGSFYTNILLRGPLQDQVSEGLRKSGNRAFISPTVDGFTAVYDEQCDMQDTEVIQSLAARLSAQFDCPALAVLNHDDDVLWYVLYEHGKRIDEYDSNPGYFEGREAKPRGGDASKLCALFGSGEVKKTASILETPHAEEGYLFEIERHEEISRTLGLPSFTVGAGYTYIERGEIPGGLDRGSLVQVG